MDQTNPELPELIEVESETIDAVYVYAGRVLIGDYMKSRTGSFWVRCALPGDSDGLWVCEDKESCLEKFKTCLDIFIRDIYDLESPKKKMKRRT